MDKNIKKEIVSTANRMRAVMKKYLSSSKKEEKDDKF